MFAGLPSFGSFGSNFQRGRMFDTHFPQQATQQPLLPSFGQERARQPFAHGFKPAHEMRMDKGEYDQMKTDWRADKPMWAQDMALDMWRDQMNAWRMNKPGRFLQP